MRLSAQASLPKSQIWLRTAIWEKIPNRRTLPDRRWPMEPDSPDGWLVAAAVPHRFNRRCTREFGGFGPGSPASRLSIVLVVPGDVLTAMGRANRGGDLMAGQERVHLLRPGQPTWNAASKATASRLKDDLSPLAGRGFKIIEHGGRFPNLRPGWLGYQRQIFDAATGPHSFQPQRSSGPMPHQRRTMAGLNRRFGSPTASYCRHAPSVWKHGPNQSYTEGRTLSTGLLGAWLVLGL